MKTVRTESPVDVEQLIVRGHVRGALAVVVMLALVRVGLQVLVMLRLVFLRFQDVLGVLLVPVRVVAGAGDWARHFFCV